MEENIAAIQHISSKSKQRVTSQRIFRFIKGALSIGCELFQDCINGLEIDGRIYKMLPFLLIPLHRIAKNDEPDNVEKARISPESPKAIKKLESFAHQVPGNFQNNTKYAYNKYTSALSER